MRPAMFSPCGLSTNSDTGTDVQTVKYSGVDGRVLWEKRASATVAVSFGDFGRSVKLDGSGNPIVLRARKESIW